MRIDFLLNIAVCFCLALVQFGVGVETPRDSFYFIVIAVFILACHTANEFENPYTGIYGMVILMVLNSVVALYFYEGGNVSSFGEFAPAYAGAFKRSIVPLMLIFCLSIPFMVGREMYLMQKGTNNDNMGRSSQRWYYNNIYLNRGNYLLRFLSFVKRYWLAVVFGAVVLHQFSFFGDVAKLLTPDIELNFITIKNALPWVVGGLASYFLIKSAFGFEWAKNLWRGFTEISNISFLVSAGLTILVWGGIYAFSYEQVLSYMRNEPDASPFYADIILKLGALFTTSFIITWIILFIGYVVRSLSSEETTPVYDPWLPDHYQPIASPELMRAMNADLSAGNIDGIIDDLEAGLKDLHRQKDEAQQQLRKWENMPVLSDAEMYDEDVQNWATGRTARYDRYQVAEFKNHFADIVAELEKAIAQANEQYNHILKHAPKLKGITVPKEVGKIGGITATPARDFEALQSLEKKKLNV